MPCILNDIRAAGGRAHVAHAAHAAESTPVPHERRSPGSCRYGTSLVDWSADGVWAAYAAHNAVVLLRPGEHRIAHMLSGHINR